MLYPESHREFKAELFRNPPSEYRGAPFWAWNTEITEDEIDRQIDAFQEMGFGGFIVHVRVGLRTKYMSEEFMKLVGHCIEKAREKKMLCWLYDEDRWSSGSAGGEVTKTVAYRARRMVFTKKRCPEWDIDHDRFMECMARNEHIRGCLLACYDLKRAAEGIEYLGRIAPDEEARYEKWYLYEVIDEESPWFNNQTYPDTMNPDAVKRFIELTHEVYYRHFGDEFGKTVPAIFTDEPTFPVTWLPPFAVGDEDVRLPFTDTLPDYFRELSGLDFLDHAPYIVWSHTDGRISRERYWFYECCTRKFSESYWGTLGEWCRAHGLGFTGHAHFEETLERQARGTGESMRGYPHEDIPGIDMLNDNREFTNAKQCQSVVHQYGKEGMLSEIFGVTMWYFRHEGYKLAGDWQMAMGVTVMVPHLSWFSMKGEAKRDYPACIHYQSPWYREYKYLSDHFARVSYILTRGKPHVKVGILHPIETFWTKKGPEDQFETEKMQMEDNFHHIAEWLATGGVDFNFISEGLMERNDPADADTSEGFRCGQMNYEAVIMADLENIRLHTLNRLYAYVKKGGKLLLLGHLPSSVDTEKPAGETAEKLAYVLSHAEQVQNGRADLLKALDDYREVEIVNRNGIHKPHFLYQMREEGDDRWLFISQAYFDSRQYEDQMYEKRSRMEAEKLKIRIRGRWQVTRFDTLNGETERLSSVTEGDSTVIARDMYSDDSLMLKLEPLCETAAKADEEENAELPARIVETVLPEPAGYRMTEKNALVLDYVQIRYPEEENYGERTEVLRADDLLRAHFGYPLRAGNAEQPYIRNIPDSDRPHTVWLKTLFTSETTIGGALLAMEDPEYAEIYLNGVRVSGEVCGFYTDRSIHTVMLPEIAAGENELVLKMRYGYHAAVERMYLLGDFGVRVLGAKCILTEKPEKLYYGDYTQQGFPFYTGNMEYLFRIEDNDGAEKTLSVPYFGGVGLTVSVNGGPERNISLTPYRLKMDELKEGMNEVRVKVLGHRHNGFGQIHLIGDATFLNARSFRTVRDAWSDVYQLKPMGILSAVKLITEVPADPDASAKEAAANIGG